MLQNYENDFDRLAQEAWERQKTPLERMYDRWVGEGRWEPDPPRVTFRIYGLADGRPIPCHLCGSTDNWVVEGDEVHGIARVFICEHEPIIAIRAAVRQISSVPVRKVGRIEETGWPLE